MGKDKNIMRRSVNQALYKYLPGSWADFSQGGGVTYAVHVDRWNSIQLTGVNTKRLLRVVNQQVGEFRSRSPQGSRAVADFADVINEESYYVLNPKVSEEERAIVTSVRPLVFVCGSCGRVVQYSSYEEFRRREHQKCICGGHMAQLKMVRFCRCGYADGIYIPRCPTPGHGTGSMVRRGTGLDFVCSRCGKRVSPSFYCPECKQKLDTKSALDSSHFLPFNLTLIDLLDKRKDVLLDSEEDFRGERTVLAHYLGLIAQEQYEQVVAAGRLTQNEEFEKELERDAAGYRADGIPEDVIAAVLDSKRRQNPAGKLYEALETVSRGLSVESGESLTALAEEVLEYDELLHAKVTLDLEQAERDAEMVNDGIRPDYGAAVQAMGFSRAMVCSGVPMVLAAYGYTRKERTGDGVRLHGFPQEMDKRNIYAARLETEGVLFELDRVRVLNWLRDNRLLDPEDLPRDTSEYGLKLWFLDRVHLDRIRTFDPIDDRDGPGRVTRQVYTLLHSVSHALISEAAELCGLDKSSLSEYLLPNIPAVFLYCSNSQGFNMGALYSAFQSHLDMWLSRARERSRKCIFDPMCIDKEKACAGCLFLNEVSCRHFNKDLDRSFLCGYYDRQKRRKLTGFWEE